VKKQAPDISQTVQKQTENLAVRHHVTDSVHLRHHFTVVWRLVNLPVYRHN